MRLWTIHPRYLDAKGLVAAWREGLLAQKVLAGKTVGYRNHPQLIRFRAAKSPSNAIAIYLKGIHDESVRRGYSFNASKIGDISSRSRVATMEGQLLYELEHLKRKVKVRDPEIYKELRRVKEPDAHPLFRIVEGGVEEWEVR